MAELSLEEVFETSITPTAKSQPVQGEMSLDSVFGDHITRATTDTSDNLKQTVKEVGGKVAGMAGQLSDMFTGIGKQLLGSGVYWGANTAALAKGESAKTAATAAQMTKDYFFPQEVSAPWSKVAETMGPEASAAYNENPIAWIMGKVGEFVEGGSKKIGETTGIPAEHFMALADQFMGSVGYKAVKPAVAHAFKMRVDQMKAGGQTTGNIKINPDGSITYGAEEPAVRGPATRMPGPDAEFIESSKQVKEIFQKVKGKDQAARDSRTVKEFFDEAMKPKAPEEMKAEPEAVPATDHQGTEVDPNLVSGTEKIKSGQWEQMSPEEASAVKLAAQNSDRLQMGVRKHQRGSADWKDLTSVFVATGAGTALGLWGYRWYDNWRKQQEQDNEDYNKTKDEEPEYNNEGTMEALDWKHLAPVAVAAGAIKMKGGMWHPKAVARLATPLAEQLSGKPRHILDDIAENRRNNEGIRPEYLEAEAQHKWSEKAISNYLNKHAGTATDPLKDVEIPQGEGTIKWEDAWDQALHHKAARTIPEIKTPNPEERIWSIRGDRAQGPRGEYRPAGTITDYLSHVGDYLRQNVKADKLGQYDLVRAVKETAENDKRVAREMEKAQASSTKDLPVYKEYPDGYKWVELRLPEELSEDQAKQVRKATKEEWSRGSGWVDADGNYEKTTEGYVAIDSKGKPIRNSYTEENAGGKTPREAWLSGKLSEEGNTLGHCVGGYCDAVASGESKIYSLRDEKGKSHVTIEVEPKGMEKSADLAGNDTYTADADNIVQIRGKQNRAPASQYLPYVQDFVRSGKWGEVGDLQNTALMYGRDVRGHTSSQGHATNAADLQASGLKPDQLYTAEEIRAIADKTNKARGQEGNADPKLLAAIAAIGGGAALGAYLNPDHPFKASLYGAGVGLLLSRVQSRAWIEAIKRAQIPDKIVRIDNYIRDRVYAEKVGDRATYQLTDRIQTAIPSQARREAIYDFLENERPTNLTPVERAVAADVRQFLNGLGELARDSKVIREMVDDYATRIYGQPAKGLFGEKKVGGNTSVSSPFGKPRGYETRVEAEAAGLTPVTTDIAQVVDLYSKSVRSAIENRKLIDTLRQAALDDGTKLLVKTNKGKRAPDNYTTIDHPQMDGWAVHPDIAPDLRFVFDNKNFGSIVGALDAINTTQKRLGVSMSLFHATALEHAMIGGTSILKSPVRGARILAQSFAPAIFGENLMVKMVREGGAGDLVDQALKDGVQISFERQSPTIAEERMPLYRAMDASTKFLNETVPHLGDVTTGAVSKLNHMFDRAMWGRFHAAMKLETYADKVAELQRNNARDVANGKAELKSRDEIGGMAASFVNDLFGGLDWYKLVTEFDSRWGREVASAAFSPSGRLAQRMVMFAPDWTISTTRAFAKSFGPAAMMGVAGGILGSEVSEDNKLLGGALGVLAGLGAGKAAGLKFQTGTGIKGLMQPTELADLHRQYFMRSALIYTAIGDAVNYQLSGHHIWENKDPTRIDLGDGRTMQASKHFMEPIHWLVTPRQQALNKLSYIIKEPASQVMDQEYLSTKGAPRMGNTPRDKEISLGTRLEHAAKGFAPISAGQMAGQGAAAGAMGFAGMPIYGKTFEERDRLKQERKEQNIQRRIDRRQRRQEQGR